MALPANNPDPQQAANQQRHEQTQAAEQTQATVRDGGGLTRESVGDYEILELIGQGGMGAVYRARHRHLGSEVALKIIRPDAGDASAQERFLREMRAIGAMNHPHIVRATDGGVAQGVHYLVMELLHAQNLGQIVRDSGPLPIHDALGFVDQAADALHYAHQQGVIHRDVKPSNLLVDRDAMLRLADLGLVRFAVGQEASDVTGSQTMLGTVDYMAPEQAINSKDADQRSDIYSLGCTLYFLLTGKPPYEAETVMGRVVAHRERDLPSLQDERPEVSDAVERLFQRMAAKRPEDRFDSMEQVRAAIRTCLGPPTTGLAADRRTRREVAIRRAVVLAVVAIPILSVIAGMSGRIFGVASTASRDEERRPVRRLDYVQGRADLLSFIDPELDAVRQPGKGAARFVGDVLFIPRNSHLIVPADAPDNYELAFEFLRPAGQLGGLSLVFRRGDALVGLLLDEEVEPGISFSTLQPFQADQSDSNPEYVRANSSSGRPRPSALRRAAQRSDSSRRRRHHRQRRRTGDPPLARRLRDVSRPPQHPRRASARLP